MNKGRKNVMKKRRGFTLIELVIVIAILGTLSSIALVKFSDVGNDSKINADYVTANNIATAAKLALNSNIDEKTIKVSYLVEKKYLESNPMAQSKVNENFEVYVDQGDVTVKLGEDPLYPKNN